MSLTGWVTPRRAAVFAALCVAWQGVFVAVGELGPEVPVGPPDLMVFQSSEGLRTRLEALTEPGRAFYLRSCFIDFVYPLLYGGLLIAVLTLVSPRRWLSWLPVCAVCFDYLENVAFVGCLVAWPEPPSVALTIGASANSLKWICSACSVLAAVTFGLRHVLRR